MFNPDPLLDYKGVQEYLGCGQDLAYQLMYAAGAIRLGKHKGLRVQKSKLDAALRKCSNAEPVTKHTRPYRRRSGG